MRKTELPFDNSGGLKSIIAIPESQYKGLTYQSDCSRSINVGTWDHAICIDCLAADAGFQENKVESEAGPIYEVEITGMIYGKSPENDQIIKDLDGGVWVVIHQDVENNWIASGANRVRMIFERKSDTGTMRSDRKGTIFSFSCQDDSASVNINPPIF